MPKVNKSEIHFGAFGPFTLGRQGQAVMAEDITKFWEKVGDQTLENAKGVYIAAVRRGKSKTLTPVYIGKTNTTFKHRLTEKHHLFVLSREYSPRRLRIFFLARMASENGGFKLNKTHREPPQDVTGKSLGLKSIDRLEFMLIGHCVKKGFDLLNTSNKTFHAGLKVSGYLGETKAGDPNAKVKISQLLGCD